MKGNTGTHGRTFTGKVIADRMHKTVTVEWERRKYVPKYERYAKRRTRVKAHNPEHINAKTGQTVKIMETRRLSKTKNFIVVEIIDETTAPKKEPAEKTAKKESKKAKEVKKEQKTEEKTEEKSELPARSTVEGMTKDEIKDYAKKEFDVELSTNDLKDEMIDQLFKEAGQ